MPTYKLFFGLALVAACAAISSAQEPKPAQEKPVDQLKWNMMQKSYVPKPDETVIKWTFKTDGLMGEKGTGDVYMLLHFKGAPQTCAHILKLVQSHFYDGIKVHRVECPPKSAPDFVLVQWGNAATKKPNWDGKTEEGTGKTIKRELSPDLKHVVGAVGLAREPDPDTGDCQLYCCLVAIPRLDNQYAVFGQVVAGLGVMNYLKVGSTVVSATAINIGPDAKAVTEEINGRKPDAAGLKFADPEGKLKWETSSEGLSMATVKEGSGEAIVSGKKAVMQYTGWLTNGAKFDSSRDHGQPYSIRLGVGQVIKGWDQGVLGMHVGEVRKLIIPSALGWGERGDGDKIPANSTVVFEVELVDIAD
jgi:FKBP-type peptidyl-prolyl cis-trans isomerase